MKIWYLAHPVLSDDQYTVEENLEHVLEVQKILHKAGILTVIPWYTWVTIYGDRTSSELREEMLSMDCENVCKFRGRIILSGHKIAEGMEKELNAAMTIAGYQVLNLIGIPDDNIPFILTSGTCMGTGLPAEQVR